MNIGKRLRRLRNDKGLTGYELEKLTGISQSIISRYETGIIEPPISSLKIICDALGISLSEFFDVNTNPIVLKELVEYSLNLPSEKLKVLIQVAKYMDT